jgi:endonuclease YncB( thermonuclease family)
MKKKFIFTLFFFSLTTLFPVLINAGVLKGKVVGVIDGDTVTVLVESKAQKQIRIKGIDAPEKEQLFGNNAREYLTNILLNKKIIVEYSTLNVERQILGKIILDGKDIGLGMIESGFAWFCEEHKSELTEEEISLYSLSQSKAQSNTLGLWQNPNPTSPWKFREQTEKKSLVQPSSSIFSIKNLTGKVTEILSGTRISVMKSGQSKIEVCISNLEVPENGQPYADLAQQHLKDLLIEQSIRIELKSFVEENNCLLGDVYLNNININLQMVRDGVGWSNKDYYYPEGYYTFESAEKAARSEKRGIWQDEFPTPPWIFREQFYNDNNSIYPSSSSGYIGNSSGTGSNTNKTVQVRGYYRQDGTYVRPYTRSAPNTSSGGRRRN